jgi:CRISPR/Cas system-associated exonuclease Cas4 (RecB family)
MKNLGTLVKDIYAVLESGKASLSAPKLAEVISNRLANAGASGPALRMSTLGEKCLRKLWYKENKPEAVEPLKGNVLLMFLIGDIIEEVVLSLAEQADHNVEGRQDTLELQGVQGHRDAVIDGVLVDVKSANSRSMAKFTTHNLEREDPFGYLDQLGAYAEAGKNERHAFLAVDKELGHIVLDEYDRKPIDWKDRIQNIRRILGDKNPPPRAYVDQPDGKSGNRELPLPCRYCQYKNTCWPGLRTFVYANGPKFLTHVAREPAVQERTQVQEQARGSHSKEIG